MTGEGSAGPVAAAGITVDQIIQRFAAKEKEFKLAREQYTYTQDVKVQTLDGNTVDGEYHQVSDVLFDDRASALSRWYSRRNPSWSG